MTAQPASSEAAPSSRATRAGQRMQAAAVAMLLCIVAARAVVAELPFRSPLLDLRSVQAAQRDALPILARADRGELARVSFACLLLADITLYLAGAAAAGRLAVRGGKLAPLIAVFLALSLVSALVASDKRSTLDVWLEQGAMMLACFLAVQCLGNRLGLLMTAGVLAAVGGALAAKAIHQVLVEIPQTVAYWRTYGWRSSLVGAGVERAFESRVRATTPTGYFGLSNLLASLLIVCLLAAVGLVVCKVRFAIHTWRVERPYRDRRDIHLPSLTAGLLGAMGLGVAGALLLTRSRGGIIAAGLMVIAWAGVMRWRQALAARWQRAVVVAVAMFLAGCLALAAYGLTYDRLPGKSMTFRWYYWTATAGIVRDHPWVGVGGGNFAQAYLGYRRAAAEEAVKSPHNSLVEALSQYGLPGGLAYLAVVGVVLVGICRPRRGELPVVTWPSGRDGRRAWVLAGALAAAVVAARWLFADAGAVAVVFVLDGIVPAVLLGLLALPAIWGAGRISRTPGMPLDAVRVAMACGVAGMFLHSMVEFNLSMAGVATAFWVASGACLGAAGARQRDISSMRWAVLGNAVVVTVAAVAIFWWPVYRRTMLAESAMRAWADQHPWVAADMAEQSAKADPLDGYAAADAGRAIAAAATGDEEWESATISLTAARGWAGEAVRRDPSNCAHHRLYAEIAWLLAGRDNYTYAWERLPPQHPDSAAPPTVTNLAGAAKAAYLDGRCFEAVGLLERATREDANSALLYGYLGDAAWLAGRTDQAAGAWRRAAELAPRGPVVDDALGEMARAVQLNPMDHRLRLQAAAMYCRAGKAPQCLEQIKAAERVDAALFPDSLMRFDDQERRDIAMFKARSAVWSPASSPAGQL